MRTILATLAVAISISAALASPAAQAAPTEVNVRVEGGAETLFEGPVLTDGHNVSAGSDSTAPPSGRLCDGTNGGRNPTPGPTPTAASVDAMSILGEDFDGQWYPGFDDYFITRWGPDEQDPAAPGGGAYWGILVNDVFSNVGGCQYELDGGDEVLWVYDAFGGRPTLALFPGTPAYASGPRPLTAMAQLGVPFEVEVVSYGDAVESAPPPSPGRSGSAPYEGAVVAPVLTDAEGFQTVDTTHPAAPPTDADGRAEITFASSGWHRIKAASVGSGGEDAIRSNHLDVCVPAGAGPAEPPLEGAADCGQLPAADRVREADVAPPGSPGEGPGDEAKPPADDPDAGPASPPTPLELPAPLRVVAARLDRSEVARGLVAASWKVLGSATWRWRISSRPLDRRRARYASRASGAGGTSATLRLPPGAYRLRLTIVDALGRSAYATLGRVAVPRARRR